MLLWTLWHSAKYLNTHTSFWHTVLIRWRVWYVYVRVVYRWRKKFRPTKWLCLAQVKCYIQLSQSVGFYLFSKRSTSMSEKCHFILLCIWHEHVTVNIVIFNSIKSFKCVLNVAGVWRRIFQCSRRLVFFWNNVEEEMTKSLWCVFFLAKVL